MFQQRIILLGRLAVIQAANDVFSITASRSNSCSRSVKSCRILALMCKFIVKVIFVEVTQWLDMPLHHFQIHSTVKSIVLIVIFGCFLLVMPVQAQIRHNSPVTLDGRQQP